MAFPAMNTLRQLRWVVVVAHILFIAALIASASARGSGFDMRVAPPVSIYSNPPREALRYQVVFPRETVAFAVCAIGLAAALVPVGVRPEDDEDDPAAAGASKPYSLFPGLAWPLEHALRALQAATIFLHADVSVPAITTHFVIFASQVGVIARYTASHATPSTPPTTTWSLEQRMAALSVVSVLVCVSAQSNARIAGALPAAPLDASTVAFWMTVALQAAHAVVAGCVWWLVPPTSSTRACEIALAGAAILDCALQGCITLDAVAYA